ncbi:MaoC family dehydratase [Kribbia dieselivorans]|uniref:MaoC family dehydratase n=1 Tax=Kribbia dieselivorans TaxID=331526 RepID=UPI0009F8FCBD|nr:MaoC family dehydratase [Kribbia dieselivorans]
MSPREISSQEELESLVGQDLGTSDWITVDQTMVNTFADATGDHQWIHVDVDKAKDSPFGGTIAHGFLTLSLFPVIGSQISTVTFGSARLNYGVESVRFPSPVKVGSRVRGTAHLENVESLPKGLQMTTKYTIEIEGGTRPACVGKLLVLIVP